MRNIRLVVLSALALWIGSIAGSSADDRAVASLSAGDRAAIMVECEQISTSYGYFLDTADADGFAGLFAPDGRLELVAAHKILTGTKALRDFGLQPPNERIYRHRHYELSA